MNQIIWCLGKSELNVEVFSDTFYYCGLFSIMEKQETSLIVVEQRHLKYLEIVWVSLCIS